jgi:tetratricopeptide (TPR) repeat protein
VGRIAFISILLGACAHAPDKKTGLDDERAVLFEFSAKWCGPCQTVEKELLPNPEVQRALAAVRFVRFDIDSLAGAAEYARLTKGRRTQIPTFIGLADDRVVAQMTGLPQLKSLVKFIDALADVGGDETALTTSLRVAPNDIKLLVRAGRWYTFRGRYRDAAAYYEQVATLSDASEELRAEADWQRGIFSRKGMPRDPRAPLAFVFAHPHSSYAHRALEIAAILKDLSPEEVAAAFRACVDASRGEPDELNDLAYHALAAHQYDLALLIAQSVVQAKKEASTLDTLAEVHYYRREPAMAQAIGVRAVTLAPGNKQLRANLERFRRADGTPCGIVEKMRAGGYFWLPRFYGDVN